MRKKYWRKHEGGVNPEIGIGIDASQFLEKIMLADPSTYPLLLAKMKDFTSPSFDQRDPDSSMNKNISLLIAAYDLAMEELGLNEENIEEAISLISLSTKKNIRACKGNNHKSNNPNVRLEEKASDEKIRKEVLDERTKLIWVTNLLRAAIPKHNLNQKEKNLRSRPYNFS